MSDNFEVENSYDSEEYNSDEDFDTDWVKNIEEENKLYYNFFITQNENVKLNINYINRNNELYDSKIIHIKLNNGFLKNR
jgi:hypothetical protein